MALRLVRGDEFIEPFLIEDEDGEIVDITDAEVSGAIAWRGRERIQLSVAAELDIRNVSPARSDDPDLQEPHGYLHLTEEQTILIPPGEISRVGLLVIFDGNLTLSTYGLSIRAFSEESADDGGLNPDLAVFRFVHGISSGFGAGGSYSPAFNFSDARNSQYIALLEDI